MGTPLPSKAQVLQSSGAVHSCLLHMLGLTTAAPTPYFLCLPTPVFLQGVAAFGVTG